jgi:hypothetical protein
MKYAPLNLPPSYPSLQIYEYSADQTAPMGDAGNYIAILMQYGISDYNNVTIKNGSESKNFKDQSSTTT